MRALYQAEQAECGLVSLGMVASAHGLQFDLTSLRARYPMSSKGMTVKDIVAVADDMGLATRAVRCDIEDLRDLRLPAILHWRMDHFVVLTKVKSSYLINDPAVGTLRINRDEIDKSFTGVAIELWPGPKFQKQDRRNRLRLGSVIPYNQEIVATLVMMGIMALAIEAIALVIPVIQEFVIDDALVSADTDLITTAAIAVAIFLGAQAGITAVRGIIQRNITSSLSLVVPDYIFTHMVRLPVDWFGRRSAADVINRFDSGNSIHRSLTTSTLSAGIDGLVAVIALSLMFIYNFDLAAIALCAFLSYAFVRWISYSSFRRATAGSLVANAKVQTILWETMKGIATIKLFNGGHKRRGSYTSALSQYVRLQNNLGTLAAQFLFAHDLIFAAEKVAILYLGAKAVLANQFSVGMLTAFLSFRENFVTKGTNLVNAAIEFRSLGIHLDRLSDILLTQPEQKMQLPYLGNAEVTGHIAVKGVTAGYGDNSAAVLQDVNLEIAAGEIVAIVGPSGCGKSTLLKVMTGQLPPSSGDVLIDGMSVQSMGQERLRDIIAVVSQDDMLFAGTIAENIAFMDERPDFERVFEAAYRANVHDTIEAMPMGYNTLIGSLGTGLSGGQGQRIMLARALYRQPKILFLDEATSHLDVRNEKSITAGLRELAITQVVIAHRPETIAAADRVIDLNQQHEQGICSWVAVA